MPVRVKTSATSGIGRERPLDPELHLLACSSEVEGTRSAWTSMSCSSSCGMNSRPRLKKATRPISERRQRAHRDLAAAGRRRGAARARTAPGAPRGQPSCPRAPASGSFRNSAAMAGTKVKRQDEGAGQREHHRRGHRREHLALDALEGEQRREDQQDDRLAVGGRPRHLPRRLRPPRPAAPRTDRARPSSSRLQRQPAQRVLDHHHRAVDDQAEVERAEAHQIAADVEAVHRRRREQEGQRDDRAP